MLSHHIRCAHCAMSVFCFHIAPAKYGRYTGRCSHPRRGERVGKMYAAQPRGSARSRETRLVVSTAESLSVLFIFFFIPAKKDHVSKGDKRRRQTQQRRVNETRQCPGPQLWCHFCSVPASETLHKSTCLRSQQCRHMRLSSTRRYFERWL